MSPLTVAESRREPSSGVCIAATKTLRSLPAHHYISFELIREDNERRAWAIEKSPQAGLQRAASPLPEREVSSLSPSPPQAGLQRAASPLPEREVSSPSPSPPQAGLQRATSPLPEREVSSPSPSPP